MPDASSHDPFTGFKFRVIVATFSSDIGFQKVSGLKESTEVVEYREGTDPITKRKLPGLTVYDPVTFTRGLSTSHDLLDWRAQVATASSPGDGVPPDGFRRTVTVQMFAKGNNDQAVQSWEILKAWPQELNHSDLDAEGSAVVIQSMILANEGIRQTTSTSTTGGGANLGG